MTRATKEEINNDACHFLEMECRLDAALWEQYGEGILAHRRDREFWDSLAGHLDCMRVCDECGEPMIDGYVIDGRIHYCSEECMLKNITLEEFEEEYEDSDSQTCWTCWFDESKLFNNR